MVLVPISPDATIFGRLEAVFSLIGSDVRSSLIEHQQRAREGFQEFAKNANIIKVLGLEHISFDKYSWDFATIHSRSICWTGMRHLFPMLYLVKCVELDNSRVEVAAAHETRLDEGSNKVSKASTTLI